MADDLLALLAAVQAGSVSIEGALERLRGLPYEDLGFARVDHHRALRTGFPEVIYCPGKTTAQIVAIARALIARHDRVLATRCDADTAADVIAEVPEFVYHPLPRLLTVGYPIAESPRGEVTIVAAGTADLAVAEEAAICAEMAGTCVTRIWDVGVAGLHRLLAQVGKLQNCDVVVVVAGMEGALASVVGGLTERPVIAVPTSVGYGASFGGVSALLTMLNSCATGVSVVNIDNGFGAGMIASRIARGRSNPHET
ncbi:MAG TPA: nickel pincer cofactor biosynthesis protein LarB [Oscillatoriaceae cyanobacterium]